MVRKMAYVGFSYLLGLLFASFFSFNFSVIAGAALIAVAAALRIFGGKSKTALCVCCIFFGIGSVYFSFYDRIVSGSAVKYNNVTVEINGVISDFTEYSGDINSYRVKGKINGGVSADIICYGEAKNCRVGDDIYIRGKASLPKNTYIFNAESYYKAKGIYLIVNSADEVKIAPADKMPVKRLLYRYRDYILSRMSALLGYKLTPVMEAMLFGDKTDIDDNTLTLLYRSGIGHIMAVSGVHLAVVCSIFGLFLGLFPLNKFIRFFILLIPSSAFVILSGASESVLRAAVMILLVYGAELFGRRADIMNSLGIAAIVLTAGCPFAVRDASLLLSFAGVIGIAAAAPAVLKIIEEKRGRKAGFLLSSVIASVCASAAVFPVSFLFFDEVSVVSPLTNIILMPFCMVILVCGVITAATGGIGFIAVPLMKLCAVFCRIVLGLSEVIGSAGISYIPLGYGFTGTIILIALIASAAVFAAGKDFSKTAVSASVLFGVCIISVWIYRFIPSDHITAAIINNGKGSSSIIIHDKKNASVIEFDKGGKTAEYTAKYLMRHGIERVELLALNTDYNTSETVYMKKYKLFNVGTVIVPLEVSSKNLNVNFASDTMKYETERTCTVSMPSYDIIISENGGTFCFKINGCNIIAYNGKTGTAIEGKCNAAIVYAGRSPSESIDADMTLFIDSGAETMTDKNKKAYFGENIALNIYKNKIRTEAISCGSSF